MSCCPENNGCVEKVPSGCVIYTGSLTADSYLDNKDYCATTNINVVIKDIDDEITRLADSADIDKTIFDAANSCGTGNVVTGMTEHTGTYYSSEAVVKLLGVICDLKQRLNKLTSDSTDTDKGDVYLLDIELDADFLVWLNSQCLGDNPCDGQAITTLRGLLQAMITKICTCCA